MWYSDQMPIHVVYTWLTQVFFSQQANLELCFTVRQSVQGGPNTPATSAPPHEYHNRWISFVSCPDLIRILCVGQPSDIHIGSYHLNKQAYMTPLRFDVDLSDQPDRVCGCANLKCVCDDCWSQHARPVIPLVHAHLCNHFPTKAITWVFSGRKGYHCWVHTPVAYLMTETQRKRFLNGIVVMLKRDHGLDWVPDAKVTTSLTHLLRLPFSLATNGTVVLPFNPLDPPRLAELVCAPTDAKKIQASLAYFPVQDSMGAVTAQTQ